jgi:hypothetical protein
MQPMGAYQEQFSFSQPNKDVRQVELDQQAASAGVPLHDLRAIDMVERALLHPKYEYRTAEGIEKETFILPVELIEEVLRDTPSIARQTPFKSGDRIIYAHAAKSKSVQEKIEASRRILAEDIG